MNILSKLRARRLGESVSIIKAKDGFNVVRLHFPYSALPGKPLHGFSIGISNGIPDFFIEPATDAFDEKTLDQGGWNLTLRNHVHSKAEESLVKASNDIASLPAAPAPLILASFDTEKNAAYALDIAQAALKKNGSTRMIMTRSSTANQNHISNQKSGIMKWSLRLVTSIVFVVVASFLYLLGSTTVSAKKTIETATALVKAELPSADTAIHYSSNTIDKNKILYIFTDPGCENCKKYHPIASALQKKGYDVWIFPLAVMEGSQHSIAAVMCSDDRTSAWNAVMQTGQILNSPTCASKDAGAINMKLFDAFHFKDAPTTILGNGVVFEGVKSASDIEQLAQAQAPAAIQ
ncbi:MAG: thioredoxin fold domain-containing protein [bacterium]|nr:thioredoxin fold domain-containing protein [bacterium]